MIADEPSQWTRELPPAPPRPVPPGFCAWVRETSGGDLCLEIGRLRRAGLLGPSGAPLHEPAAGLESVLEAPQRGRG